MLVQTRYYVDRWVHCNDGSWFMDFEHESEHNTTTTTIIAAIEDYYSDNEYIDYIQDYSYLYSIQLCELF